MGAPTGITTGVKATTCSTKRLALQLDLEEEAWRSEDGSLNHAKPA